MSPMSPMKQLFIFTFLFFQLSVFAQFSKFELKQISQEHGLPGVTVRQIFQDSKGIIWLGVESYGLCKYDGYSFELHNHNIDDSLSISNNVVEAICEDKIGNIWLGTQSGLNIFDRSDKTFKRIFASDTTIPHNLILDLKPMPNGDIWIGTGNGACLYSAASGSFTTFTIDPYQKVTVHDITCDNNNAVWFATDKGIYRYGSYIMSKVATGNNSAHFCIEPVSDSIMLIGTADDIISLDINTRQYASLYKPDGSITDIYKDSRNLIWVSSATKGVVLLSEKLDVLQHYEKDITAPNGLKSNAVRDVFEDENGLMWFGLKFEGIQIYNHKIQLFSHFNKEMPSANKKEWNSIIAIYENTDGKILLGTSKGFSAFDPNTAQFRKFTSTQLPWLEKERINCFAVNKNNELYIGSEVGLFKTSSDWKRTEQLLSHNINDLIIDKNNQLWIGSKSGLLLCDNKEISSVSKFCSTGTYLKSLAIKTLFEDSHGNIWIGTHQSGLYVYDISNNTVKKFKTDWQSDKCVSGNLIRDIYEDKNGYIWITTRGQGLNKFSYADSTFTHYTEKDGLPTNTLFGILEDDLDNLWITSYQGLCKFNYTTKQTENFTKEYGLQNDIFEPNATCKTADGTMYIGGNNGFNMFRPEEIKANKTASRLVLTSIKIFDQEIATDLDSGATFHLSHNENNLSFDFSLLDYNSNLGKRYSYIMEGLDEEWTHTETRHFASYTNLKPGNYIFKVKAVTKDGIQNENPLSIAITVDSPLWQKAWFKILVLIFIALVIILIFYTRINHIKRINTHLERIVEERTADLKEKQKELIHQKELLEIKSDDLEQSNIDLKQANVTKNTLVSIIAHDLKNQFQAITSYSVSLGKKAIEIRSTEFSKHANQLENAAKSVSTVLENLLNWYRTQNADMTPVYESINLNHTVHNIAKNYALTILDKNITYRVNVPDNTIVHSDKEMLKAIIRNIVNNAVKFTQDGGIISVSTEKVDGNIHITIADDGIGISPDSLETLFLFDAKNGPKGLGMQICKEFTDVLDANLQVDSEIGKGTSFCFHLPVAVSVPQVEADVSDLDFLQNNESQKVQYSLFKNKKILIVDDNNALLEHLISILAPYAKVFAAVNGEAGLKIAKKKQPDLIITDFAMPKMNGLELIEKLQADSKTNRIPTIMLTAQNFEILKESAYTFGINDFMPKPFDERMLFLKIQNIFKLISSANYDTQVNNDDGFNIDYTKPSLLHDLITHVKENISNPDLTVEMVAEHFNLSRSTLHRKLKKETEKSALEIINDIRFTKAKKMLKTGKYNVSEVSWSIGFSDVRYFSRKFKEFYGSSPSNYSKQLVE